VSGALHTRRHRRQMKMADRGKFRVGHKLIGARTGSKHAKYLKSLRGRG
jgi:hypothetical protein